MALLYECIFDKTAHTKRVIVMAMNKDAASPWNRDLQNSKRPLGYAAGYARVTWDHRLNVSKSGSAPDLMTLACANTVKSHAATVQMNEPARRIIATSFGLGISRTFQTSRPAPA